MNIRSLASLGMIIAAFSTSACSAIRVVEVSKEGGAIALLGNRNSAMEKARKEMAATCGGPGSFEVVRQGEVVVGEVTTMRQSSRRVGRRGRPRGTVTHQQAVTEPQREWRIYYECVGNEQTASSGALHQVSVTF